MANPQHVEMLKRGVEAWNSWRNENLTIYPQLSEVNLRGAKLREANLSWANLKGAHLTEARLGGTRLNGAHLNEACLVRANLSGADLRGADLTGADLSWANLSGADLRKANLRRADLRKSLMLETLLTDVDLSEVHGLEEVGHHGPSSIGIDTIFRSDGKIPEVFLRGAGVPEIFITYMPSLTDQPLQFYDCFISYSSRDETFAGRLYADLQAMGVRCWFAPEDLKIGDIFMERIEHSIRVYSKLVIILSKHSIESSWVEREVDAAFEKERKQKSVVLLPIRLDKAVMETEKPWAAEIRRRRHIGDFTKWRQPEAYQKSFDQLLDALKRDERESAPDEVKP